MCFLITTYNTLLVLFVSYNLTGLDSPEMQLEMLLSVMEELPPVNKLLLSWLFVHMNHIVDKVDHTIIIIL